MENNKDITKKLKKLGLNMLNKAKTTYKSAKDSMENNFLKDSLRRRFNLENPYKFIIMDEKERASVIGELLPRNAKRYNEDDIFVFYGGLEDNDILPGYVIKDLSDNTLYQVKEVASVKIPVTYEDKEYEVDGTAVYGIILWVTKTSLLMFTINT